MKKRHNFLQGAIILTIAMVIVKVVGALFKVPLSHVITENGMGYFNTAYNFYAVFFSLATAGFPIAIAKMVAENYSSGRFKDVKAIKSVSVPIFFTTGVIGMSAMIIFAQAYTEYIGNEGAFLPIIILSPTLLFCCLNSVYRGYFEGLRNMFPTAVSQVIEALAKLLIGLIFAVWTINYIHNEYSLYGTIFGFSTDENTAVLTGYSYAAAAAILGVSIGSFLSYIYLFFYYKKRGDYIDITMYRASPTAHSRSAIRKKLFKIALPIAIGSLALSISSLIDQTFLQRNLTELVKNQPEALLEIYKDLLPEQNLADISTIPNFLFGCHAYAVTIFLLVPALTQALGTSALPNLTSAWASKNMGAVKFNVQVILKITALIAFPAGIGISSISKPLVSFIYGEQSAIDITGNILAILGVTACFSAMSIPISAMLQAIGKEKIPVKILMVGLLVKIVLNYMLCSVVQINVNGAAISSFVSNLLICILGLVSLKKYVKINLSYKNSLIYPFFCAMICGIVSFFSSVYCTNLGLSDSLICLISIACGASIYLIFLFLTGTVNKNELKSYLVAKKSRKHL